MELTREQLRKINTQLVQTGGTVSFDVENIAPTFVTSGTRVSVSQSDYGTKDYTVSISVILKEVSKDAK